MAKKPTRTDADRRVRQCERLGRLLRLLQLIMSKGRWDADGLAAELECSRRTVYRFLQTLSLAGVPWYFDDTCRAYRVRPGFRFPELDAKGEQNTIINKLVPAIKKLIVEGDAFLKSMRELLDVLTGPDTNPMPRGRRVPRGESD